MRSLSTEPLAPPALLGMLGGGQLGRMFIDAAHARGYAVAVLCPDADAPAHQIADRSFVADYTDTGALAELADTCPAVSYEFENVPQGSVRFLEQRTVVHPSAHAIGCAQHRADEKRLAAAAAPDTPPVPWHLIECAADLDAAWAAIAGPGILKTARFGYDGKGQYPVGSRAELADAFAAAKNVPCVLEARIALESELSVLTARTARGSVQYPVVANTHRNGILHCSMSPAPVAESLARQAQAAAMAIAESLAYCGVLAVEFFVDGADRLYFNEMAPRPHNSGHHTIDACHASQFDQQVLAMTGHAPATPTQHTPCAMVNLLGDLWAQGEPDWNLLTDSNVHLHLYGKHTARPGRKMGHFCVLDTTPDAAGARAEELFARLTP